MMILASGQSDESTSNRCAIGSVLSSKQKSKFLGAETTAGFSTNTTLFTNPDSRKYTVYSQRPNYLRLNHYVPVTYSNKDYSYCAPTASSSLIARTYLAQPSSEGYTHNSSRWMKRKGKEGEKGRVGRRRKKPGLSNQSDRANYWSEMRPSQAFRNRSLSPSENLLKQRPLKTNCVRAVSNVMNTQSANAVSSYSSAQCLNQLPRQQYGLTVQLSPRFVPSSLDFKRLEPFEASPQLSSQQHFSSISEINSAQLSPKPVVSLASSDSWISSSEISSASPTVSRNYSLRWKHMTNHPVVSNSVTRKDACVNSSNHNSDSLTNTEVSSVHSLAAKCYESCSVTSVEDMKVRAAVSRDVSTKRFCGSNWDQRLAKEDENFQVLCIAKWFGKYLERTLLIG
uniref:CKK domain-containing protein n=1 Tax=Syphacia muris TaxID=451379 RepID=A0A0N5AQ85_9BILA